LTRLRPGYRERVLLICSGAVVGVHIHDEVAVVHPHPELGQALDETPYTAAPPHERAAHLFGVRIADVEQIPPILEALRRRDVYVSQRGASIRVSPHVYNTKEDIMALAEALRAVAR